MSLPQETDDPNRFSVTVDPQGKMYELCFTKDSTGIERRVRVTFPLSASGFLAMALFFLFRQRFAEWLVNRALLQFKMDGKFRPQLMPDELRHGIAASLLNLCSAYEQIQKHMPKGSSGRARMALPAGHPLRTMYEKLT